MNKHIIVEHEPHALRNALLSATLSCGIFFTLGFFGREVWDYHMKEPVKECVPEKAKKSMKWSE